MRNLTDPAVMHNYVVTPIEKILSHRDDIVQVEERRTADAELVLVAYGTVSRCAAAALDMARAEGLPGGTAAPRHLLAAARQGAG